MTLEQLKKIMKCAAAQQAPTNYSLEAVDKSVAEGLTEYCGSINKFMKNRYDIYEIMIETIDSIVPNNVISSLSPFAEVRITPQGQKTVFKQKANINRGKRFLTRVGLSGVYETFRLDNKSFEVPTYAIGGAVTVDLERVMDNTENLSDVMQYLTEGMADSIFGEVQKAMRNAYDNTGRPAANKYTGSSFNADEMVKMVNVVKSYGRGQAVIYAPTEFVAAMGADAIVPVGSGYQGVYSQDDIDQIHRFGRINLFRGTPVIEIPQSYVDENNTKTQIDPQIAYVLPTGGEKVVKVVLEGDTQINDFKNRDNSIEINTYRKMGVAIITHNNWGIYKNTGITNTYEA